MEEKIIIQYCSWCFYRTEHKLNKNGAIGVFRDIYKCTNCNNFTVKCRFCDNMSRSKPKIPSSKFFSNVITDRWNNFLCAEHDGTIHDFDKLAQKLDDIEDYKYLFKRKRFNLQKIAITIGGVIVFVPISYLAAPAIASALGAAGMLGSASTGTAISSLSGAALKSASLAAIGGGKMATGVIVLTAAGSALGGVQGAKISNAYFNAMNEFKIIKENYGSKNKSLIYVNGFLTEKDTNTKDWRRSLHQFNKYNSSHNWYYLSWESKNLFKLGNDFSVDSTGSSAAKYATKLAQRASVKAGSKLNPLFYGVAMTELISNPWHQSIVRSQLAGVILADLISRSNHKFTLFGHSLGCRLIYYCLLALSTKSKKYIDNVYLLGGAMDKDDKVGWQQVSNSVSGNIFNYYSKNDFVLKALYKGAQFGEASIGHEPINIVAQNIINIDATDVVNGHTEWKSNLSSFLNNGE